MSEQDQGPEQAQVPSKSTGVSRKSFLTGAAGAGVGGLIVGGGVGYAIGNSGSSSSSSGGSKSTIKIGSATPITGPYAGDGQQMLRGQQLAIEQINAAGGVGGHPLELVKVDTKDQSPDVMKTAIQNLVSKNVAAVFMPFCSYTSVEFPILAEKNVPTFHVNTWHGNVDWVAEHKATNIFQGDPSELSYGAGIISVMQSLIHGRRLDADEQDDLRRHVERPLQPQHRQQLQVRDREARLEGRTASTSSRCRRPTGAACSSRSAMPSPA